MSGILTVSALNRYMSFKIKEDEKLRGVLVRGEISGFVHHRASGHFYFALKDRESAVKCVMFSSFASRLKFMPQNGMSVIIMGSVQVFERDGVYQLYATDIQPEGLGALYLAAEQLKEKLLQEGLFDEIYKKPLPAFPKKIGIVTAKGGAALQDILNILGRRYPVCEAVIFPCLVQGEYAPGSICEALETADNSGVDLIICGRGGGSAEDLAAFNSERVARTVFAMNTPVISAVGHETDTTVIDLVADLRAPTPSAAAELSVPDMSALQGALEQRERELKKSFEKLLREKEILITAREGRLRENYPTARIAAFSEKITAAEARLGEALKMYFGSLQNALESREKRLDDLSPLTIMSRGYGLIYKGDKLAISARELKTGDRITLVLADGEVSAVVD
ncbi:MAG: exodeoxyribonuclease VII large subunit [Oscillospiraceae bacterium]|nr:exodeoxyribonuclease VII large subunit [Oscillospiraceae bacterium]